MDFQALGQHVTELRASKGVSQQVLADAIGISRATINALEKGRSHDVGVCKVMKILSFFDYDLCIKQRAAFPTFEELRDGG
jgi:transcriptional regulator with XRE-family HTH domain